MAEIAHLIATEALAVMVEIASRLAVETEEETVAVIETPLAIVEEVSNYFEFFRDSLNFLKF
jgi:hypothetical protein